jgi:transcriptional regulator with XRE-family HTH domain
MSGEKEMQSKVKTKFRIWVDEFGGIQAVAKKLNVTEYTVRVWLRGENTPDVKTIVEIIKLSQSSNSKLSFDDVYKSCTRNLLKKKRRINFLKNKKIKNTNISL